MPALSDSVFYGTSCVVGVASGTLLASNLELSFCGGVDPKTGEVIDRFQPLSGRLLKDVVLAIPGSRGSCGGSVITMELLLNGLGPKAFIFARPEEVITLGVLVAEEFFQKTAPVVVLSLDDFTRVTAWNEKTIHVRENQVLDAKSQIGTDEIVETTKLEPAECKVQLSSLDRSILDGARGEGAKPRGFL